MATSLIESDMAQSDPVNILLVDDQPARLLTYRTILDDLHENLVEASSGTEALRLLMAHDFAVILLDVNMPVLDGFETASLIHEHPRFENTPIIFISAINVTDFDRMRGYRLGAFDYVMVPIIPEILRSKVIVLTELFRKRRDLEVANRHLAIANDSLRVEKAREFETLNNSLQEANNELASRNTELQAEIAERTRIEARLLDQDKRKDEFLAMLAHELRNPLAAVANAAHAMKLSSQPSDGLHEIISRQVALLVRLIEDLLDVARIRRGKLNFREGTVSLNSVLDSAIETAMPQLKLSGHVLEERRADRDFQLRGDGERLAQVFSNLINNAAKYSSPGSRIELEISATDAAVEILLTDHGIGLTREQIAWIFDLFAQVDTTLERARGGLGIGLTLARKIIEMHDGQLTADSEGIGRGSRFTVRLPLNALPELALAPPSTSSGATPTRRILVVDDNHDSADTLKILLECLGHTARCIYDSQEAVAALDAFQPDIVFLDIGMPVLTGYDVARLMRAHPKGERIVLVALTGWGQPSDRRRTSEAGFDHHLVKPTEPGAIERICNGAQVAYDVDSA